MAILVIKVIETEFRIEGSQARIESFVNHVASKANSLLTANLIALSLISLKRKQKTTNLDLICLDLEFLIQESTDVCSIEDALDFYHWDELNFEISIEV